MVLTDQKDTSFYPPTSLESTNLNKEDSLYSGLHNGRVAKSGVSANPTDTYTNPNDYVQQLTGSGSKIGSCIVLKVMAGDKFNLRVSSWYKLNGANPGSPGDPLSDLLSALSSGISGVASGKASAASPQVNSGFSRSITSFMGSQSTTGTKPKA